MCGRYALTMDTDTLMDTLRERYGIEGNLVFDYHPRYNIAPGQQVVVIINDGTKNRVGLLQWGLIPSWAQDPSIGNKMFNARAENLSEKPAFKHSFLNRRCLILADSFYEWKKDGDSKIPLRVKMKDNSILALAGLWSTWKPAEGSPISSCTVITTTPNPLMAQLHHRMPVMLSIDTEKLWLNPEIRDPDLLASLLTPFPPESMEAYEVSSLVNSWKNDTPDCIKKVGSLHLHG